MKITVLNGSPKGSTSATMQYVHFIQKKFPQHELRIHNISQQIKTLEKDEKAFQEILEEIRSSDGVLWAFPLYYFTVASQYKRFIELIFEREAEEAFRDRYAAVLTTSIHFFDHTAHNYLRAICDDLGMKYVGSFSADMYDLLSEESRTQLILFAENLFRAIEKRIPTSKANFPIIHTPFSYVPSPAPTKLDAGGKKIVIIGDEDLHETNLHKMVERFRNSFAQEIQTVHLTGVDIKGGCLGCIQCGYDNTCVYTGKDGFIDFFNSKVKPADILVFAGTIRDRYLSSRWKMFFDRSFFNTHTPYLAEKQVAFIISGPLGQISNLRQILEAYTQLHQAHLVDIVTDESADSGLLDGQLQQLAEALIWSAEKRSMKPATFLGIGGRKVFRDDIWARLRFPFRADHEHYKEHGLYDFPQKDYRARITSTILLLLTRIPRMRKEIYSRSKNEMIKPLQKVVRDA